MSGFKNIVTYLIAWHTIKEYKKKEESKGEK
jgi:hypothetical protein